MLNLPMKNRLCSLSLIGVGTKRSEVKRIAGQILPNASNFNFQKQDLRFFFQKLKSTCYSVTIASRPGNDDINEAYLIN